MAPMAGYPDCGSDVSGLVERFFLDTAEVSKATILLKKPKYIGPILIGGEVHHHYLSRVGHSK